MSHLMTKPTKWQVRPAKTQISFGAQSFCWFCLKVAQICTHWSTVKVSGVTIRQQNIVNTNKLIICDNCSYELMIDYENPTDSHHYKTLIRLGRCPGWSEPLLGAWVILLALSCSFEPPHDKTNKMACAPSENSDQSGHPPSLISLGIHPVWSVFAVRMKKAWVLSYPLSAQRRLWSDWADAQADLSLRWAHSLFVGFVMRRLICFVFFSKRLKVRRKQSSNASNCTCEWARYKCRKKEHLTFIPVSFLKRHRVCVSEWDYPGIYAIYIHSLLRILFTGKTWYIF